MKKFAYYRQGLDIIRQEGLLRHCTSVHSASGPVVRMADGTEKILFCSNNYLNLASDSRVCKAAADSLRQFGVGSGASRLVCGSVRFHAELEEQFAAFLGKEAALFVGSGWAANQIVLNTLPRDSDMVLLDKFDHASIIDAAKAGPAPFRTFRRNQPHRLEKLLADCTGGSFIVTESIFSMDGDIADLAGLVEIKQKFDSILIVDEAHGFGCFGPNGAGLCEQQNVLDQIDILVIPLGKAVGASGGIIAGPKVIIDYLINKARPFIYTTAPGAAVAAAALRALDIIRSEPDRRLRLARNADFLRSAFAAMGLNTLDSSTHIIPVVIGPSDKAVLVSQKLYEMGFFISAIRPPTVAPGTARLRVSVQADHTEEQLNGLCRALGECKKMYL